MDRVDLINAATKNKKLQSLLQHQQQFVDEFNKLKQGQEGPHGVQSEPGGPSGDFKTGKKMDTDIVEGRDINVCVRVRPLMGFEEEAGYFPCVLAMSPKVISLEPRLDVKGNPRPIKTEFHVDNAFGPDDTNNHVYESVTLPLVDLGLKGGVCTMLAYGQTGSGKTHTITGILDRICIDLFKRQGDNCEIKIFVSFFELLGNEVTDLLDKSKAKLEIMEDKFGKINVKNAREEEICSPDQFQELISGALNHRQTRSTFKNDTSSRSHAVCSIRLKNYVLKEAEDGKIFVIDLAGSENASDSQFHDRSLVREKRLINTSLMSMKECIRNRALSALNPEKYYHIPFRQSRLTLLLKDAFEVESHRHCKTVIIACVSPSCADMSMTMNTLRYVTPIKIGQFSREKVAVNPSNPAHWDNQTLRRWVLKRANGNVDPEILCPFESGMQLLRLPETEFLSRVLECAPDFGEKRAKQFYTALWKLLIDSRTRERKDKLKYRKQPNAWNADEELLKRIEKENVLNNGTNLKKKPVDSSKVRPLALKQRQE